MAYPVKGWKNKVGTGVRVAPGGKSWKAYWEENSDKSWPIKCCIKGCNENATDGAHMYCPSVDRKEWIVPTCHAHNMSAGEFELKPNTNMVRANVSVDK